MRLAAEGTASIGQSLQFVDSLLQHRAAEAGPQPLLAHVQVFGDVVASEGVAVEPLEHQLLDAPMLRVSQVPAGQLGGLQPDPPPLFRPSCRIGTPFCGPLLAELAFIVLRLRPQLGQSNSLLRVQTQFLARRSI